MEKQDAQTSEISLSAMQSQLDSSNGGDSNDMSKVQESILEQEEIWKEAVGYEGRYEVSNLGRIRTMPKIITGWIGQNGYWTIKIKKNGESGNINVPIHQIVASAFIRPTTKEERRSRNVVVNHKDGNKLNNRVDNLEYVTQAENIRHALRTGLTPLRKTEKVTQDQEDEIITLYLTGNYTQKSLATKFGLQSINHIVRKATLQGRIKKSQFSGRVVNGNKVSRTDREEIYKRFLSGTPRKLTAKEFSIEYSHVCRIIRQEASRCQIEA